MTTNHDGEMFKVLYEEKHGFGSRWKYWFNCAIGGVTMHILVQIYVFALGCKIIQELKGIKPLNRKNTLEKFLPFVAKCDWRLEKSTGLRKASFPKQVCL